MQSVLTINQPGAQFLMMGNEAITRGALEAGVQFCSSYPGSPSAEILALMAATAKAFGHYAEWSTNEIVAIEAATAASFAGLRSLCIMKQNGANVAADFLMSLGLSGCRGGLVVVFADDPESHSSTNEFDSRNLARWAELPLLEPGSFQEAKDMTKWAFELSEQTQTPVIIRSVTRICHGRGNVVLGDFLPKKPANKLGQWDKLIALNPFHPYTHQKLAKIREIFETSSFNTYTGPENPELLILTSGTGGFYSREAVSRLGVTERVGILKLGTTCPLPAKLVKSYLEKCPRVLVVEEVDPFLEQNVMVLTAQEEMLVKFFGKASGHIKGPGGPGTGELNPDVVMDGLSAVLGVARPSRSDVVVDPEKDLAIPARDLTFCAGCPHRASFFAAKNALEIDGRQGVVMGDIGCYTMGGAKAGHFLLSSLFCMGGGIGMASGMGKLEQFGFDQPVLAMAGDSTFFHACLPGLVNARWNNSNMLFLVLDNEATAMTGFQPHPGTGQTAMGEKGAPFSIEGICQAMGADVHIADPYDVAATTEKIYNLIQQPGVKVLILRRTCALVQSRRGPKPKVWVDQEKCLGDACGCGRFCSKVFGCPACIWDAAAGKARIDEVVCNGCGVCASLCPQGAIQIEGRD
ncbi:MAG: thiamine pyrophosphate-dependent enzyme [Syntrophomonadales bacterium]|jgi:indolepyruvate ferredoxin oxidoreductase alpha subunit